MSTKHTPGPWAVANWIEVHDRASQCDESGARIGETPNRICVVEYPYSDVDHRHGASKEANARLIAAAPDLLAACKALLDASGDGLHSTGCVELPPGHHGKWCCEVAQARAAVAKAEG